MNKLPKRFKISSTQEEKSDSVSVLGVALFLTVMACCCVNDYAYAEEVKETYSQCVTRVRDDARRGEARCRKKFGDVEKCRADPADVDYIIFAECQKKRSSGSLRPVAGREKDK